MSRKRKISDSYNDRLDIKQRQRMTSYNLNNIFQITQQKLYDGTKNFFRKLKDNENKSFCSCMHCTVNIRSACNYCERQFCSNHLIQCEQCEKIYCLFCSTNMNNESSICWTCIQN